MTIDQGFGLIVIFTENTMARYLRVDGSDEKGPGQFLLTAQTHHFLARLSINVALGKFISIIISIVAVCIDNVRSAGTAQLLLLWLHSQSQGIEILLAATTTTR